MSKSTTVDAAPEATGESNVEALENTTGLDEGGLSNLFSREDEEPSDVSGEDTDGSETEKVEEPATEPEPEPEPEDDSSLTEDAEAEPEGKDEEEEEEPTWFRKRIDKITAQRKAAEEKIAALEAKLTEKQTEEAPASTVDQVMDLAQLETLEKQALEAEDQVDELLDTEPKYDDDGEAYWQVGNDKLNKKQLIAIRKNARQAYRAAPARREFLQKKATTDANIAKIPFFSDPEDPYYAQTQELLNSPIYKELESKIPDAKAAAYLMIRGRQALDAELKQEKKPAAVKKPTQLKSTPTSKAAVDTGTTANVPTPMEARRKELNKLKSQGSVDEDALAKFF